MGARARSVAGALLAVLAVLAGVTAADAAPRLITVYTGDRNGVYYHTGAVICALVNAHRWTHGIRCVTEPSNGSVENLSALRREAATFAIVQSDWQSHAVYGTDVFQTRGPDSALRSVMALYPEPFTVLARGSSRVARFSDLRGKRVNIGPAGSGTRATMEAVMQELGWSASDFGYLADLSTSALMQALCRGDVDAAVLVIAHPNLAIEDIMSSCDVVLVPVDTSIVDLLVATHPYYLKYAIPSGTYPGQTSNVNVFALAATLVTSARTPPAVARVVAKAVMDSLPAFRTKHPSFAEFDIRQMLSEGLTAPMHSTVQRFYDGAGLLPRDDAP